MNPQFLQKNLQALHEANPDLAARVEAFCRDHSTLNIPRDASGQFNLKIALPQGGEGWLYGSNLQSELQILQNQMHQIENPQILLWLGNGLGHHLITYLQKPHPKTRYIIVVEPSLEFFISFLCMGDFTNLLKHPAVIWLVGMSAEKVKNHFVELRNLYGFVEAIHHNLIVEWGYSHPDLVEIKEGWQRFVDHMKIDTNINPYDAYYGFANFVKNLSEVSSVPLLDEFHNIFSGKPGLLIAAGPSLDLSLPYLQDNIAQKAVVFAAGSALRLLQDANVKVHFTGCLERAAMQASFFTGCDTSTTTLVTTPVAHPGVYQSFQGKRIHIARPPHFLPWVFPDAMVHEVGMSSVTHLGLYLLWYCGCRPIYLVGQDLAFAPRGEQVHASNYHYKLQTRHDLNQEGLQLTKAPANAGGEIETSVALLYFAWQYQEMIQRLKIQPCYNVIPKEYGMKIEGTERIDPKEVFTQHITKAISVEVELEQRWQHISEERIAEKQARAVQSTVEGSKIWTERFLQRSLDLIQEIYTFYRTYPPSKEHIEKYQHYFQELEKQTNAMITDPVCARMMGHLVMGKQLQLTKISYAMLKRIEEPEDLKDRLAIPLAWLAENVVRAKLVLDLLAKK